MAELTQQDIDDMIQAIMAGRFRGQNAPIMGGPGMDEGGNYDISGNTPPMYPGPNGGPVQPGGGPMMPGQVSIPGAQTGWPRPQPPSAVPSATLQSDNPDLRMKTYRTILGDLLENFTFSLASGLSARAKNPRAGIGEALMAPFELAKQRRDERYRNQQIQLSIANEEKTRAASQELMDRIRNNDITLPAKIQEMIANAGLTNAKTTTEGVRPGLVTAQTAAATAAANKAKWITTPNGLYNTETKQIEPNTSTNFRVKVTASMAKEMGLPTEVIGDELRAQDISSLAAAGREKKTLYKDADGVWVYNESTGDKTKLGNLPPTAGGTYQRMVDDYGNLLGWYNPSNNKLVGTPLTGARATALQQGQIDRTTSLADLSDDVNLIKDLYPRHKSVIGSGAGRVVDFARGLMNVDPEINDLFRTTEDMKQKLVYLRSGKQINDKEFERLNRIMPNPKSPIAKFESDLRGFERELQIIMQAGTGRSAPVTGPGSVSNVITPPANTGANTGAGAAPRPPGSPDIEIGPDGKVIIHNNKQQKGPGGE